MKTLTTSILTIALVTIASFTFAAQGTITDVNPSGRMAFGLDENGSEVIFVNKNNLPIYPGAVVEFEKNGNGNGKGGAQVNEILSMCPTLGGCN